MTNISTNDTLSLISKVREIGNNLILQRLKEAGCPHLSPSHGDILVILYKNEILTMKNISNKIRRTKATVTILVDKLEKQGLVKREKSQEDSRVTNIVLTKKGEELKPIFIAISNELNEFLHKNLSKDEALELNRILRKIVE